MDGHSKSQVKRLITQSPEYAAGYQAGREAGMREAEKIADTKEDEFLALAESASTTAMRDHYAALGAGAGAASIAILSAIGGGK